VLTILYVVIIRCILPTAGYTVYTDTDSCIWLQPPGGDFLGTDNSASTQPILGKLLSELTNENENPAVEFLSLGAKR
jgi:hypothetical protein